MIPKKVLSLLTILILMLTVVSMTFVMDTEAAGAYPNNHNMQDYEPSVDDQWDLDVAQAEDGRYFAVWADDRLLYSDIRFSKSQNGSSWGDGKFNNNDRIVNSDSGEGNDHWHPSITVDPQPKLYCVWLDDGADDPRLMFATSNNSGIIWTPAREIDVVNGTISEPVIRWSPTAGLIVVYTAENPGGSDDKDIMMIRSTDMGQTFSSPVRVNQDDTVQDQSHPDISVSSTGRVVIVWEDYRNGDSITRRNSDIFMAVTDDGMSFSENIKVGTDPDELKQQYPDAVFSGSDDIMVVWQESTRDGWRARYSIGWSNRDLLSYDMSGDHNAVRDNLTIRDEFKPVVGYIEGAFVISWTSVDSRNFYLVRTGYVTRGGEPVSGNHIVDNTKDLGRFINDPDIFIAEMVKETVSVIGYQEKAQVFWLDHRTDPNPSNDIAEDSDPYTATAFPDPTVPRPPTAVNVWMKGSTWDEATVEWSVSRDVEFNGYFLTIAEGDDAPLPDPRLFNGSSSQRLETNFTFRGLEPDTRYTVRLMTQDKFGLRADSPPVSFTTGTNSNPTFIFQEPDGIDDSADSGFMISWYCSDPEETAEFIIHYDTDLKPDDQVFLHSGTTAEGNGYGQHYWNTTDLPQGGYTLNATIDDGVNDPVTVYSPAIIVTHRTIVKDHPRILSASVEGGRQSAFTDPELRVTFSKPISPVSLNEETVYMIGPFNERIEGSLMLKGNDSIRWYPGEDLEYGEDHSLVLLAEITDMNGVKLDGQNLGRPSSYTFDFNTRSDEGIPVVRDWSPQGSDAPLRPTISFSLDIPVSSSTVNTGSVILVDDSDNAVPIVIETREDGTTFAARTERPLRENSTYRVKLSRNITSVKGKNLSDDFEWGFSTGMADMSKDRDGDGVPDDLDLFPDDPEESNDLDGDGIGDNKDLDRDGDGMSDSWEEENDLDPDDPRDASLDPDNDGKTNLEEFRDQTDPRSASQDESSLWPYLFVGGVGVVVMAVLVIYAVTLRTRLSEEKAKKKFFREE